MYEAKHNAILMRREECSQLFLVFTGLMPRFAEQPLDMLQTAGLQNRNVMIFRDPSKSGYMAGCSEGIRSFGELLAWQREVLAGMPHVRKVYAIGVSSGALAAMLSVNHLGGECSWVFGPRMHSLKLLGTTEAVRAMGAPVELSFAERMIARGQSWRMRLRRRLGLTAREALPPRSIREIWRADFERMLADLEASQTSALHHLYYVPTNPIDRTIVEYISARCRQVRAHTIIPPPDYPREKMRQPGWDHTVFSVIAALGNAKSLVPPFEPAGG